MGNQKRQKNIQPASLKIGDSVVVKSEVNDPEYGGDISGWQGRITELIKDEDVMQTVMIAWDS